MKRVIFLIALTVFLGCRKNKSCNTDPLDYLDRPIPAKGVNNYLTKDHKGRAMVKSFQDGCEHDMVFIKGHWCEKRSELIIIEDRSCSQGGCK